jgi:hypothetical protein
MDDMFGLARFKHNFSLRQPWFLVYRHQCPRAEEKPAAVPSANIPVQSALA